ncbi:hypothetical protein [Clostridium intestinale]|jgi:hypothetical protein|uniref:Uncharacterized protein n=1 Tax=Clostridium intestinale TaxID=36845 RepID=A0A7D6VUD0_9CLOT|nr:hypothetical protein [Clostridium intestinale]QLY79312.1 hypothetical protein HZF06_20060 [Clostridium intestinale]
MALQLNNYTNGAGVKTQYWKITDYSLRTIYKSVDITFGGWVTKELSDSGNYSPVEIKKVRCLADKFDEYFSSQNLDENGSNPLLQMYKFAKDNSEFFKDSIDV